MLYVICFILHRIAILISKITHKGGTYMTLLNTVCNLGGNWLATLALWAGKNLLSTSDTITLSTIVHLFEQLSRLY